MSHDEGVLNEQQPSVSVENANLSSQHYQHQAPPPQHVGLGLASQQTKTDTIDYNLNRVNDPSMYNQSMVLIPLIRPYPLDSNDDV